MAPLDFLYHLRDSFREDGIRFAITSGMACVYYGLQQYTKTSDWIIHPDDLEKLRAFLEKRQRRIPPWRISYRAIFGAPLEKDYLAIGWTSHLFIIDRPDSPENHVDFFGKPPRVQGLGLETDDEGFATRRTVAMMKRTDRDKDWPIVDGIGWQLAGESDGDGLVHIQSVPRLLEVWNRSSQEERSRAAEKRPLLNSLKQSTDARHIEGLIRLERLVWECVNRQRYRVFTTAWKDFFRRWRAEENWDWPTGEEFAIQHRRLTKAASDHNLPINPMEGVDRSDLTRLGKEDAASIGLTTLDLVKRISPPDTELLP